MTYPLSSLLIDILEIPRLRAKPRSFCEPQPNSYLRLILGPNTVHVRGTLISHVPCKTRTYTMDSSQVSLVSETYERVSVFIVELTFGQLQECYRKLETHIISKVQDVAIYGDFPLPSSWYPCKIQAMNPLKGLQKYHINILL